MNKNLECEVHIIRIDTKFVMEVTIDGEKGKLTRKHFFDSFPLEYDYYMEEAKQYYQKMTENV